ncbi:hypothetical protein WJX84_008247 [Apatococcus fuscideae]
MSFFMLLFISLLIASAWQTAFPKLQTAFFKHTRDSFAAIWTTINDNMLDYLETCMIALNGKARLYQGSGKVVFEHDEHGVPVPPHEFVCPLTHEIMSDPVTLLTGMTYDRHSIKNWIDLGHTTCPMTQKQLAWRMNNRVFAARNYALRHLIDTWVEEYLPGKDPRTPLGEDCRDAVVLFGPSQPQPQAAALPAANRSHMPRPEMPPGFRAMLPARGPQPAPETSAPTTGRTAEEISRLFRTRARMHDLAHNHVQS